MKKQTGSHRLSAFLCDDKKLSVTLANVETWDDEAANLYENLKDKTIADAVEHIEANPPSAGVVTLLWFVAIERSKTENARANAERLHNKPGGSREKQEAIRAIWAKGKYTSRDQCAEQEYADLRMSFSTARKALRNTPKP